MRFHPEQPLKLGFLLLALALTAWQVWDEREALTLPPGYGAAGDQERLAHTPADARGFGPVGPVGRVESSRPDGNRRPPTPILRVPQRTGDSPDASSAAVGPRRLDLTYE